MIDWRLAGLVAQGVVATGPAVSAEEAAPFAAVDGPARESAALVGAYTGLVPATPLPAAESIDRGAWTVSALGGMRVLLDPVVGRMGEGLGLFAGPIRAAGGALLAAEVGAISGVLAQRVLGQYEFAILDPTAPTRLLFVAPNLAHAARSLDAEPDELLRWVALHEITHALQFAGVPWLRAHLAGRVGELLASLDVQVDPRRLSRLPSVDDLRGIVAAVRRGELATLVLGGEQRAQFDEMQALMAVIEGYAEHVMDAVGRDLIPRLEHLREGMNRRRRDRTGVLRLLEQLIGLDMKLRQYEVGKAFCDAVVAEGGIAALNRVWAGPALMPSAAELEDPGAWLARTEPGALRAS